jgi:hypothetical protein
MALGLGEEPPCPTHGPNGRLARLCLGSSAEQADGRFRADWQGGWASSAEGAPPQALAASESWRRRFVSSRQGGIAFAWATCRAVSDSILARLDCVSRAAWSFSGDFGAWVCSCAAQLCHLSPLGRRWTAGPNYVHSPSTNALE